MSRSIAFANIENTFRFSSKEELIDIALESVVELSDGCKEAGFGDDIFKNFMLLGVKMSVAREGALNNDEKYIIDEVLGKLIAGGLDTIYEIANEESSENDYEMLEKIIGFGDAVAMPLLYLILAFAYIDGTIEDEFAERLDRIYNLTMHLTELESDVVEWFEAYEGLHTLVEIVARFKGVKESELRDTIDSLIDKEILFSCETITGPKYGLMKMWKIYN